MFSPSHIDTLWIDPSVTLEPSVLSIRRRFPKEKIIIGSPPSAELPPLEAIPHTKRRLYLTRHRGRLVKPCPGSPGRICCGYWVINAMIHCPMDCHYCILQTYLSTPAMTIFLNEDQIKEEVLQRLRSNPTHIYRFGTGELGDSLVHNTLTGFADRMVPFFAETKNGILELKTKTAEIDTLRNLDPKGHTVISWSLNPPSIVRTIEPGTASFEQRLLAARECQEMGYWIGLHFDPVFWFDGWEKEYSNVIEKLSRALDPSRILWISLAGFRYTSSQKDLIRQRFPHSPIFLGEFFRDEDGKYRYLQHLRISMYRTLLRWFRDWSPTLFLYFCMENRYVWEATFSRPPRNTKELDQKFDKNVWNHLKNA